MQTIEDIRLEALRSDRRPFRQRYPSPVLVLWQTVVGDLQFAPKGSFEAQPREGNTLVHVPRVSPEERVRNSLRPGRKVLDKELWNPVLVEDGRKPLRIGRERGSDIRLNDFTVSATHAWIWGVPSTDRVWIEDADSRNGTVHNGVSLVEGFRSDLHSGDELIVGQFVLLFLSAGDFHRYLRGELG